MTGGPIAIIPARGGSKRFPGKNLEPLEGNPLLAHAILDAQESDVFDTVCVTSDDPDIREVGEEWNADLVRERPHRLATDDAQVKDVCSYLLEDLASKGESYQEFAVLLPTAPLRTPQDVAEAYEKFNSADANYLLSLVRFHHPPQRAVRIQDGYIEPAYGRDKMVQTQKLEPLYRHDGSIIFARTEPFLEEHAFYGSKAIGFEMPPERAVDVDEPIDLEWARFLKKRQN